MTQSRLLSKAVAVFTGDDERLNHFRPFEVAAKLVQLDEPELIATRIRAGVTITAALASLYTGRRGRPDTAMAGEITLSGLVFPVGGLKEKILAARRAGIRRILLPSRNEADIEDLPEDVRKELQIVFVSRISDVIDAALEVLVAHPPPPPIVTNVHPDSIARQSDQTPAPLAVRQS